MILHIVSRSPFTHDALERCRTAFTPGDLLLLIEDGVLALATPDRFLSDLQPHVVYVLRSDAQARGMTLPATVEGIDYTGFVDLVARCSKSVSWF